MMKIVNGISIRSKGIGPFQKSIYIPTEIIFNFKRNTLQIGQDAWRVFNFKALNINCHANAKLLLNPFDSGFSKDFGVYGFREPLNSHAMFKKITEKKPVVLDVGSNLGYFALLEIVAGARKVISIEPVPITFSFLSKTLSPYNNVELFNLAMSDEIKDLRLFVGEQKNVTSADSEMLNRFGQKITDEIIVKTLDLTKAAKDFPFTMIRMDVEGHEYKIFNNRNVPEQLTCICIELHVLHPYNKSHAIRFLTNLANQGFHASTVINEMNNSDYPLIQALGLKEAYNLASVIRRNTKKCPKIQYNLELYSLIKELPDQGQIHLILER